MANTLKFGNGEWYGKKDTILAYNDENNNYKPLPFDFSRASSATRVNKAGLIETVGSGEPRIDFKDNTKGALLLEPSRTNLITNSNNLTTWNGAAMTRTFVDDLINPSSVLGGSKLTQTSSGGYAWLSRTFTGNETFSAFVKKDSSNFARLYAANNTVYFDIVNGTIETEVGSDITDKSIIDYGNGWFRVSMSVNSTAASYVRIYPASSGSSSSGTNSLFVYGTQLEQGSYATSYIPTSGSAVTRLADACNNGGNEQVINSTEGVFYAEVENSSPSTSTRGWVLQSSLNNGSDLISIRFNSSQLINMYLRANSVTTINVNVSNTYNGFIKIALKYKSGENSLWINGVEVHSNSTTFSFSNSLSNLSNYDGLGNYGYFNIKDTKLYNTALTDNELQKLTTI